MSCWNKVELENMLEDVINELELSEGMIEEHGPLGTPPARLVRLVLDSKDMEISALRNRINVFHKDSGQITGPWGTVREEQEK